MPLWVNTYYYK